LVDRQVLAAREDLHAAKASAARCAVALFRALGGGWNPQGKAGQTTAIAAGATKASQ
jgi:outer membrane protein TolC